MPTSASLAPCRTNEAFYSGVERLDKRVGVSAVNHAGFLDRLSARRGTAEAVHADAQKELCGFGVLVKYVADNVVFCDSHSNSSVYLACGSAGCAAFIY